MKNRHDTPVTTPQFGGISLMHRQLRKIMSGREACFVSIYVYFCLHLPQLFRSQASITRGQATAWKCVRSAVPLAFLRALRGGNSHLQLIVFSLTACSPITRPNPRNP